MASTNKKRITQKTYEGATSIPVNQENALRRAVMSTMLWEDSFYESGEFIADRIKNLSEDIKPEIVEQIAIEAKEDQKLRHAPLYLVMSLLEKRYQKTKFLIDRLCTRPDDMTELLSMYWQNGKKPIAKQLQRGLACAFTKFDEYQLAKYNREKTVQLRDVLFLSHAKPKDENQDQLWKKLINGTLQTPNTWETNLSAGKDKKETFHKLISEGKLGALAYIRNLRGMDEAGLDRSFIKENLKNVNPMRILPFQLLSAAKHAKWAEQELESLLFKSVNQYTENKISGKTKMLVDVSGSMLWDGVSSKNFASRMDAAASLAAVCREMFSDIEIYAFDTSVRECAPRRGFALIEDIVSNGGGGTSLGSAVRVMNNKGFDRLIVITDEQSRDAVPSPNGRGYIINIGAYDKSVGYGDWFRIDGWSDAIAKYIAKMEN